MRNATILDGKNFATATNYYIGSSGGPGEFGYFQGIIDEAKIFNRELSATEINRIFGGEITSVRVPLHQYAPAPTFWPMAEDPVANMPPASTPAIRSASGTAPVTSPVAPGTSAAMPAAAPVAAAAIQSVPGTAPATLPVASGTSAAMPAVVPVPAHRIAAASPALPGPDLLVEAGSLWRYIYSTEMNDSLWYKPDYQDLWWLHGCAPFGASQDAFTVLKRHESSEVVYFRTTLRLNAPDEYDGIEIALPPLKGLIVFVNGERMGLPAGDGRITKVKCGPALLKKGVNVVAVAVPVRAFDGSGDSTQFDASVTGISGSAEAGTSAVPRFAGGVENPHE